MPCLDGKHTFPKGLRNLKLQWSLWHSEKSRAKGLLNASKHHQQVRVSALNSVFPVVLTFTAPSLRLAAWPPCGPQWWLDKPLTSIIKCGTVTILNLTLHSQLSYHVSLSNLAGTFCHPMSFLLPCSMFWSLPSNPRNSIPASQEWNCWTPVLMDFAGQHLISYCLPSLAAWRSLQIKKVTPSITNHCWFLGSRAVPPWKEAESSLNKELLLSFALL